MSYHRKLKFSKSVFFIALKRKIRVLSPLQCKAFHEYFINPFFLLFGILIPFSFVFYINFSSVLPFASLYSNDTTRNGK